MFYSETLLQKSGPLARFWLAANLQRKLSKKHVLQSNITDSIAVITTPSQVPMALRLSSQLLLGAVRIYQRKMRYLLDDCDDAWIMMKMAFRPSTDHDIPISRQLPDREILTLPDEVTPYADFEFPPPLDVNWLLSQIEEVEAGTIDRRRHVSLRDIYLPEEFSPSHYSGLYEEVLEPMESLDLDLDFGIELGREAPAPRPIEEEMVSELEAMPPEKEDAESEPALEQGFGEITMGGEEFEFHPADISRARITESPLSEMDEALAQEIEAEYTSLRRAELQEPEEQRAFVRRPEQRIKKQRILVPDEEITLSSSQIQDQQANRDSITKPTTFIPRDPFFVALIEMQKTGGFVSSIMMEGRSSAWAPELRGMLSLGAIQEPRELKRKRPIMVGEVEPEYGVSKSPRLELSEGSEFGLGSGALGEESLVGQEPMLEILPFEGIATPLVPPAERPPVSIATEYAVHVLRHRFGPEAARSPGKRASTSIIFQDVLPEYRATKAEATRMFFECLVLATKNAIKVEQGQGLGDDIRMWAKEGLWEAWAERDAGGEMAPQVEPETVNMSP
ncbi:double-strand-break repair protein rad21 [Dactylonectria estremocensis]|uniref:Double-strand-break repair protein rad21 n=1 Tax=Dactylonectria estremocensis TaxID=1079267 RepID=A0A9P9EQ18_9HYPO|nr:double-strand-break repair protein rad21 [Dactylonectria estremocensis]